MDIKSFFYLMEHNGIDQNFLWDLAFETGLIKRKRLLTPSDILFALCSGSVQGTVSHNDAAAKIDAQCGVGVSRQSVWKKAGKQQCEEFLKRIMEHTMKEKMKIICRKKDAFSQFERLVVEDSTIIRLPQKLFEIFSGVRNAHSIVCNARIQVAYCLISERFVHFSIDPYSKNDLSAAKELELQKGDLTLRDRGYLIADEVQRHLDAHAHCIYRHKYGVKLLNVKTSEPIDILDLLKRDDNLDMEIMLNNKARTIVRLVAAPVCEEIANVRRMKAKKESKKTLKKEYLELLSWSIYLTTINSEAADFKTIFKIYKLRWRIEVIFKCWKSHMEFNKIHNVSKSQLFILLYARLTMILLTFQSIFKPCSAIIKDKLKKDLSLIKVIRYLSKNQYNWFVILKDIRLNHENIPPSLASVAKYCSYEKRKRTNFQQELDALIHLS